MATGYNATDRISRLRSAPLEMTKEGIAPLEMTKEGIASLEMTKEGITSLETIKVKGHAIEITRGSAPLLECSLKLE